MDYEWTEDLEAMNILQENLNNLSEENFEETLNFLLNSQFLSNKNSDFSIFVDNLLLFVAIRIKQVEIYAKLFAEITKKVDPSILDYLMTCKSVYKKYLNFGYFVRKCYEMKLYDFETIESIIFAPLQWKQFDIVTKVCSLYFYNELKPIYSDVLQNNDYKITLTDIEKCNNFFCPQDSLEYIILHDDIYNLQLLAASNFDFNMKVSTIAYSKISLINLAALYGSPQCFKFIYMNSPYCIDDDTLAIQCSAIQGGSLEIIKLLKDISSDFYTISPQKIINHAIIFHRNHIIRWIFDIYDTKQLDPPELLSKAVSFCNYDIFLFIIETFRITKLHPDLFILACKHSNPVFLDFFISNLLLPTRLSYDAEKIILEHDNFKALMMLQDRGSLFDFNLITLAIQIGFEVNKIEILHEICQIDFPLCIFHDVVKFAKHNSKEILQYIHYSAPKSFRTNEIDFINTKYKLKCIPFETSILVHNEDAIDFFLEHPSDYIPPDRCLSDILKELAVCHFNNFVSLYQIYYNMPCFKETVYKLSLRHYKDLNSKLTNYHLPIIHESNNQQNVFNKFDFDDLYGE